MLSMTNAFLRSCFRGVRTLARSWAYVLALVPVITDWLETGHFPRGPRDLITEVVVGAMLAVGIRIIYRDMARLRTMAETDALTGVCNRHKFFIDLEREVVRARRLGTALSLAYVDVDAFKAINDHHGHAEGDRVLREVAQLLRAGERRQVDSCYRLGGDEFAVLLVGADREAAVQAIRRTAHNHAVGCPALQRHKVELSFGVAELDHRESPDEFLHRADATMYDNKRGDGANRLTVNTTVAAQR
jgi:diguanylate cyclase (GGDEF)-like protein